MPLWVTISIGAAFLQNARSALQKQLSDEVGTLGATYARFLFALLFTPFYVLALGPLSGVDLPAPNWAFLAYCLAGGTAQVLATAALLYSFTFRNFAVGTTFSKTETIQTAIIGFLLLGEGVSLMAGLAILISFFGVIALSMRDDDQSMFAAFRALNQPAALYGMASGLLFGLSGVSFRAASLTLGDDQSMFVNASMTLLVTQVWQTLIMSLWFLARAPETIMATIRAWKLALPVGLTGMMASAGWFTALALFNAAYVRAVGQMELLFALATSVIVFKDRITRREVLGMVLVTGGIVLLLLYA